MILRRLARSSHVFAPRTTESLIRLSAHLLPAPRAPSVPNPFGAPHYREIHDLLAERVFRAAFEAGIFVGHIRTRLALPGWESKGPKAVAEALLSHFG